MLYERKSIFKVLYYPQTPECAEVHYKVPVKASARNALLLETHAVRSFQKFLILMLNSWNTGYAEVQSQSFRPVEGSRLNLRYMNLKQ